MKYPLLKLAHFPESYLQRRLYLHLNEPSKLTVPDCVEIPQAAARPAIPELVD